MDSEMGVWLMSIQTQRVSLNACLWRLTFFAKGMEVGHEEALSC